MSKKVDSSSQTETEIYYDSDLDYMFGMYIIHSSEYIAILYRFAVELSIRRKPYRLL